MLKRAARLLTRLTRVASPTAPVDPPPRRWADDIAEGGVTSDQWIATRGLAPRLFVDIPAERVARLRKHHPDLTEATLEAASRVLRHEFNLLGSGPYTPVDPDRPALASGYSPIDWYVDPVSGERFPRGIPQAQWDLERMRPGRADIKLPWELARCQHWPVLGQAYRLSRDDKYAHEIAHELRDFMESNPVGVGINWTCTMDVAIRAANWAVALELVRSCPALPREFWAEAYEALFDHGVFIERHLENTYEVTSNHFLSNVVGLFYLAAVFNDLPRGRVWAGRCRAWLEQEMSVQVLPDGADYESSVPYHRLVTELFLGAAHVAKSSGEPLSGPLLERVRGMVDFLAAVLRPDGLMPQVGDADDGRLHILSGYGVWRPQDPRHLFGAAACFFSDTGWRRLVTEWSAWEAEWWGFDSSGLVMREAARRDGVSHFPHAGVTVLRDHRDYLLITNGVVGTAGFGNHKHNDLLGFEFHVDGTPVLVDPGSYVYTSDPDARNLFRSTRSHNTLMIDGEEQNELRPDWLFRLFEKATPEHLAVVEHDDRLEYRGRHRGYARLAQPVVHERAFTLSRASGALSILDVLEGQGTHKVRWHFHFAPGVEVEPRGGGRFEVRTAHAVLRMMAPSDLRHWFTPAWYSQSYGVRLECVALELETVASIEPRRDYLFQLTP